MSGRITLILAFLEELVDNLPAQTDTLGRVFTIDPVVITATRTSRKLSQLPGNVSVIPEEEISWQSGIKLCEVLENTGRLNMNRPGGIFSLNPVVSLRGLPGDEQCRTLVLLDGMPLNLSDNGEVRWNMMNRQLTGRDFHYYVETGDSVFKRPVYRRENITRVEITGFELSGESDLFGGFKLHASYSYNRSRIKSCRVHSILEGKTLKYVPVHQIKGGLRYISGVFSASLSGRYKSKQYTLDDNAETDRWGNEAVINRYFTMDVSVWKEWKFMVFKITASNIFNKQYLDNALFLAPGRMIQGSIGVKF